jgi:transposase
LVGSAVSPDDLALACRPEATRWRVAQDRAGMAQGLAHLRQRQPTLLVLAAPGGWQGSVVAALAVRTRPVAVMHPRHRRDVAQATGALAKTAALDAGVMAHVAAAGRPTPRPRPDAMTPPMDARLQRRRPRRAMVVAARHRVARAHPAVRDSRARQMDALQGLLHATAAEVAARSRTSPAWREKDEVLQSAPGSGPVRAKLSPAEKMCCNPLY